MRSQNTTLDSVEKSNDWGMGGGAVGGGGWRGCGGRGLQRNILYIILFQRFHGQIRLLSLKKACCNRHVTIPPDGGISNDPSQGNLANH